MLGVAVSAAPASLRLLAVPLAVAWLLCRWEVDGRPPHCALLGLIAWCLRSRQLAALRRVPPEGAELAPLAELSSAPDLTAPNYPRGDLRGPARILLRYPVTVESTAGLLATPPTPVPSSAQRQDNRGSRRPNAPLRGRLSVRQPHYFFWANLVLRTPTDAWAVYQLQGHSYPGLAEARKVEVGERLEALAYTLEADFQILRVARSFDARRLRRSRALSTLDPSHGHHRRFRRHIDEHRAALRGSRRLCARRSTSPSAWAPPALRVRWPAFSMAPRLWRSFAGFLGFEEPACVGVDPARRLARG